MPRSFEDKPTWSKTFDTSYRMLQVALPEPVQHRPRLSLLPQAIHAIDKFETDVIPVSFLERVVYPAEESASQALLADRPNNRVVFKFGAPPLTGGEEAARILDSVSVG